MEKAPSGLELDAATDDELVARTLAGEGEAFGTLWDRHSPRVYSYAYRRLGDREQAEDVTAETFRRALAKLGTYRGGGFRSWLFAIAHNAIIDEVRARRPFVVLDTASDQADIPAPDYVALANAEMSLVFDLLPRLTAGQREVIELRLAGLAPQEIAQALGKGRPAIDMAHHRAVERLRSLLGISDETAGGRRYA